MTQASRIKRAALAASIALAGAGLYSAGAAAQGYDRSFEGRDDGARWAERDWHDQSRRQDFERGYRLGRRDAMDEAGKRPDRMAGDRDTASEDHSGDRQGARGDGPELQQHAAQRARDAVDQARSALRRDDRRAAEDALERAEQALGGRQGPPSLDRSLDALESALERDDPHAAMRALQRAREAARSEHSGAAAGGQSEQPSSGSDKGGAAPAPAPKEPAAPNGGGGGKT